MQKWMDGYMDEYAHVSMILSMYGWINEWMKKWMDGYMDEYAHVSNILCLYR